MDKQNNRLWKIMQNYYSKMYSKHFINSIKNYFKKSEIYQQSKRRVYLSILLILHYLNCVISFLRLRHEPRPSFQVYLIAWSRLLPEKAIVAPSSEEIPLVLWKPNVYFRVYNRRK